MTNAEMNAIQVQDAPVFLKRKLAPGVKLLGQALVETTNRAGTGRDSHERLGDFSYLLRACPGHEHLGESVRNVRFIATVAFKDLGVELPFTVSRHFDLLDAT